MRLHNIKISIPLQFPLRITVQAQENQQSSSYNFDFDLLKKGITIRSAQGKLNNFIFSFSGALDISSQSGKLTAHTIGLRSFFLPLFSSDNEALFQFLLKDKPQTIILAIQDGYWTLQGIPVLPLQ